MNSPRRAVVTGLGPVTPIGIGKKALWEGVLASQSGIDRVRCFDPSEFHAKCAAEIPAFDPSQFFPPHRLKRLDRFAQFSVASAQLAVDDSGLSLNGDIRRERIGVSFGTALGGISNAETQHAVFREKGLKAVNRTLALQVFGGSAHSNIAIEFGFKGVGTTNSNSCASGNVALGDAYRFIRDGLADVVIAGGAEAPLSPLTFAAFDIIKTMSRTEWDPPALACRPFDRRRDGFVMAEGAAALVVEEYEHAKKRGAHIYGEILGYSLNNEAYHMTSPEPGGEPLLRAMRDALADAQLHPGQLQYINAHGSSTAMNDANEARCIQQVFGSRKERAGLAVSGTKAATGHPLGAAAAIEAVITLLAMQESVAPPTLHLEEVEDDCDLDLVPHECREHAIQYALSNSFGFGGINSCLILGKI